MARPQILLSQIPWSLMSSWLFAYKNLLKFWLWDRSTLLIPTPALPMTFNRPLAASNTWQLTFVSRHQTWRSWNTNRPEKGYKAILISVGEAFEKIETCISQFFCDKDGQFAIGEDGIEIWGVKERFGESAVWRTFMIVRYGTRGVESLFLFLSWYTLL